MMMDDVSSLLSWFNANGGTLDSAVGFQVLPGCGRGAVALRDIPEGHVLFKIPREILLSTETCKLPQLVGLDRWKALKMHLGWAGLILCMMWETAQGPSSKWDKYLESLPKTFDTPMFWSDIELDELKGTTVVEKLGKADAEQDFNQKLLPLVHSRPDIFPPEILPVYYTLEIYHIMGSRILSRSFDVEKDDDDQAEAEDEREERDLEENGAPADTSLGSAMDVDGAQDEEAEPHSEAADEHSEQEEDEESSSVSMVPIADMLNARYGSENAKLFYEKDDLRMVSTKPIQAGEQIWNTYGDMPNAELLRRYGHVDMLPLPPPSGDLGNPGDVVEISADLALEVLHQTDQATTRERIDWWLEQGGDDGVVLESDLEIPEALIALIRLLRLTPAEWEKAVEKDKVPKPKLDAEIIGIYPTSLADDLALLAADHGLSLNKRHALIVRIGEKRILQMALEKIEAQRQRNMGGGDKKRKMRPDEEVGRAAKTRRR
ncbi:SET domain-containing protein [Roridomyces roridus]|uniref:SET domain-containing protein n=1 Tax=Roridomyces roridus TaxID=1738132 RepID=A0AAD7CEH7_9AGAR|nr:SET domain-containing protein [Roridomyces roridus]